MGSKHARMVSEKTDLLSQHKSRSSFVRCRFESLCRCGHMMVRGAVMKLQLNVQLCKTLQMNDKHLIPSCVGETWQLPSSCVRSPFILNLGIFEAQARILSSLRHLLQKVSGVYRCSLQYCNVLHQVSDMNCLQKPCVLSDLPLKNKISCCFFGGTECLRQCTCGMSLAERNFLFGAFIRLQGIGFTGEVGCFVEGQWNKEEIYSCTGECSRSSLVCCKAGVRVCCFFGWYVSLTSGFLDALACSLSVL